MTLNDFKDCLFDLLNESDELDLSDIISEDRKHRFILSFSDGSRILLQCQSLIPQEEKQPTTIPLSMIIKK